MRALSTGMVLLALGIFTFSGCGMLEQVKNDIMSYDQTKHRQEPNPPGTDSQDSWETDPLDDEAARKEEAYWVAKGQLPPEKPKPEVRPDVAGAFGATCKVNRDCQARTCFVGRGDLGYCTQICSSGPSSTLVRRMATTLS